MDKILVSEEKNKVPYSTFSPRRLRERIRKPTNYQEERLDYRRRRVYIFRYSKNIKTNNFKKKSECMILKSNNEGNTTFNLSYQKKSESITFVHDKYVFMPIKPESHLILLEFLNNYLTNTQTQK